ncbi:MAG: hypothetical protein KC636_14040 [Myxococcales bacterium]|nr:hypothetical protein [Myxococcales bacterium]
MASYQYKLVAAQAFTSNWDERPTAVEQLEAFLRAEGEQGWVYEAAAVKIRAWVSGKADRHKHASLEPASGGTHLLVHRRA